MFPPDLRYDTPVPVPVPPGGLLLGAPLCSVQAGFPSPAEDEMAQRVDLMKELVLHPQATFFLRVRGESMREAGILDGSVVLVDKAITPRNGHIVIAVVNGEFTCKQLVLRGSRMQLKAANPTYPTIIPSDLDEVEIWGVVVAHVHQHVKQRRP